MHHLGSTRRCRAAWQPRARPSDLSLLPLPFLRPLPAVYVGNLAWATSTDDLRQLFGAFGQVEVRGLRSCLC